jgi:Flp pilus assembly protein TadD
MRGSKQKQFPASGHAKGIMRRRLVKIFLATASLTMAVALTPRATWSQNTGVAALGGEPADIERADWRVFGKITDFKGQPVLGASVVADIGLGKAYVRHLATDAQGGFTTVYDMESTTLKSLQVRLTVTAAGYHDAYESVDFNKGGKTWEIDIVLPPASEGADELRVDSLVETLAPRLRSALERDPAVISSRKDLDRGTAALLDSDAVAAIPSLQKAASRNPDCGHCRTLLGLAMLSAGDWNGAGQQFLEADKLAQSEGTKEDQAESRLIVGEMENWKGEYSKAAGLLMQAKDLDPKSALILQEFGRTLVFQKNWEAADHYLEQATRAGAPKEALLLRVRALLEEGDPSAAEAVMKQYVGGASLRSLSPEARSLQSQVEARVSLQNASEVQSVVNEPLPDLVKAVPELEGLEAASSQDELPAILHNTGENVHEFFTGFQNTVSLEQVREERLSKEGKVKDFQDLKFQYLLLSQPEQGRLELEEYRTNSHGDRTAPTGLESGFMLTSGFASASLLFLPDYQSGAKFRYLGRQTVDRRTMHVVAFAETPDKAQMIERFNTNDGSILVLFQGLAWIDADTYKIVRLRTDLLKPESKIRLQRQTTEITYDPVQFKQMASAVWLPSEVAVTVQWAGKTFRNLHKYSDFKLFNTGTEEHLKPVGVSQPQSEEQRR